MLVKHCQTNNCIAQYLSPNVKLIKILFARRPTNYKLPLITIHFSACNEADTALSLADFSRSKAMR